MASPQDQLVVSEQDLLIYSWIVPGITCQIINIFGIVTNTFNIVCFVKQGFKDSVNISLLGLSVSDLGSLAMMLFTCMFLTPAIMTADLPFDPMEVMYLTSGMVHFSFTRVSSCITAMITVERCLCITSPLKIKSMITPRRTTVITVCVFIIIFCSGSAVFGVNKLDKKFFPFKNRTIIGIVSTKNRDHVETISFVVNNFSIPICTFVIISVCTTILAIQLHRTTKWRNATNNSTQIDRVSSRNQKTAKMVVMISMLFIVCFIPISVSMLAIAFLPEFSVNGKYLNLAVVIFGLGYLLEVINASTNIFIYYYMSSKYRDTLRTFLCLEKSGQLINA